MGYIPYINFTHDFCETYYFIEYCKENHNFSNTLLNIVKKTIIFLSVTLNKGYLDVVQCMDLVNGNPFNHWTAIKIHIKITRLTNCRDKKNTFLGRILAKTLITHKNKINTGINYAHLLVLGNLSTTLGIYYSKSLLRWAS